MKNQKKLKGFRISTKATIVLILATTLFVGTHSYVEDTNTLTDVLPGITQVHASEADGDLPVNETAENPTEEDTEGLENATLTEEERVTLTSVMNLVIGFLVGLIRMTIELIKGLIGVFT